MYAVHPIFNCVLDQQDKTVVFFHDESTFSSNEDQSIMWGEKGQKMIKPKSKGAGIMVSDFIDELHGFLAFSDQEYEEAKYAHEFLEYGESSEGYWNRDKFIRQMERAAIIAELKYPKSAGW